jgi:hypothetical protein
MATGIPPIAKVLVWRLEQTGAAWRQFISLYSVPVGFQGLPGREGQSIF